RHRRSRDGASACGTFLSFLSSSCFHIFHVSSWPCFALMWASQFFRFRNNAGHFGHFFALAIVVSYLPTLRASLVVVEAEPDLNSRPSSISPRTASTPAAAAGLAFCHFESAMRFLSRLYSRPCAPFGLMPRSSIA